MMLRFLYNTIPGRILLRPLTHPAVSKAAGAFLDTSLSKVLICPFVKSSGIDTSEYDLTDIRSFNDFFRRSIKPGMRTVDMDENAMIAPCDGLLSIYKVKGDTVFPVKQSAYTLEELLKSKRLAERYEDGYCFVYRLCVNHYHRYIYAAGGKKSYNRFLPGRLHTVRPVALHSVPVFAENSREYALIKTEKLGTLVQMEVGAMLVGRITNHKLRPCDVLRGEEKGFFEYGGSTIIVLAQKDKVVIDDAFIKCIDSGEELPISLGTRIGKSLKSLM